MVKNSSVPFGDMPFTVYERASKRRFTSLHTEDMDAESSRMNTWSRSDRPARRCAPGRGGSFADLFFLERAFEARFHSRHVFRERYSIEGPYSDGRWEPENVLAVSELEYGGGTESWFVDGRDVSRTVVGSLRSLVGKMENAKPRLEGLCEGFGASSWIMVVKETESGWTLGDVGPE